MAEPLDPKLYYATAEEAITAGYSSPIEAKFAEWLKTAKPGDTFDWFAETAIPTQKGESSKFVGTGTQGKPIIESITSAEKTNWRAALVGAKTQEEAINNLINLGYAADVASFLVKRGNITKTGNVTASSVSGNGSTAFNPVTNTYTASDGTKFTDQTAFTNYQKMLNENTATKEKTISERRSAFQILREEFERYGLGQLVGDVENLIIQGTPPAEYAFQLRQLPTYKQRFAANQERIKKGLRALDESSYIALEDQYQDVMRRYGLPETYYQRDEIGTQKAFEKLIAADVSNVELERRIQNTQSRIFDANPEVMSAMRQFYPGITNGEILAYALDPQTALPQLERKIAAAEIGGAALQAGLGTSAMRAEELAAAGITKAAAQEQYGKIAQLLPRAGTLAEIYRQGPYTQAIAETEAFGLKGATEATKQRQLLTELERAQFAGQSGAAKSALARERAGQF